MPRRSLTTLQLAIVLGLGAALLHSAALAGGLVWDDVVVRPAWGALRLSDVLHPPDLLGAPLWRPMITLSAVIDQRLWGGAPAGWHLTNLVLHGTAVALTFLVARRLTSAEPGSGTPRSAAMAVAIAMAFAMHPAVTEVTDWICARADALALAFGLGALLAFLRARRSGEIAAAWGGGALLFLALLSKETAAMWPPLAVAILVLPGLGPAPRDSVRRAMPAVLAVAAYGLLRARALGNGAVPVHGLDPVAILGATGFYVRQALLPFRYSPYVAAVPRDPVTVGLGAIAILSAVVACVREWKRSPLLVLGILWAALGIAPSVLTATHPITSYALADRHLYAAVPGLALAIADALSRLRPPLRVLWPLAATLGIACATEDLWRDRIWTDERRLWQEVLRQHPESRYAWGNLGLMDLSDGRSADAEADFRHAVESDEPGPFMRVDTASMLATIEIDQGRLDEAAAVLAGVADVPADEEGRQSLRIATGLLSLSRAARDAGPQARVDAVAAARGMEEAASRTPGRALPFYYLGLALDQLGERVDALAALRRAERLNDPGLGRLAAMRREDVERRIAAETDPYRRSYDAARAAQLARKLDEAKAGWAAAAALGPDHPEPLLHGAETAAAMGDPAAAAALTARALALLPDSPSIAFNLGFYRAGAGDFAGAAAAFEALLKRAPAGPLAAKTHANLAEVYARLGRRDDAAKEYRAFLASPGIDPAAAEEIQRRLDAL